MLFFRQKPSGYGEKKQTNRSHLSRKTINVINFIHSIIFQLCEVGPTLFGDFLLLAYFANIYAAGPRVFRVRAQTCVCLVFVAVRFRTESRQ